MSIDLRTKPSRPDGAKQKRSLKALRFKIWVEKQGLDYPSLFVGMDYRPLGEILRDYGQHMWETRQSCGDFKETITAVLEPRRDWKSMMVLPWDLVKEWSIKEPTDHTAPLPLAAIRAAVCVALLLLDFEFVCVVLCAFGGGCRVSEAFMLRRRDIMLPFDMMWDEASGRLPVVFLILRDTKTHTTGGAVVQHAMIDDPAIVAFLVWWCTPMARDQPIFPPRDYNQWCVRWAAILTRRLDLPTTGPFGFTPNCLRASHSTESYVLYGSVERIRWQLRHKATRVATLEHYIQELPAALARAQWSDKARVLVTRYSARADQVLAAAIFGQMGVTVRPVHVVRSYRRRKVPRALSAPPRPRISRELAALNASNEGFARSVYWPKKLGPSAA